MRGADEPFPLGCAATRLESRSTRLQSVATRTVLIALTVGACSDAHLLDDCSSLATGNVTVGSWWSDKEQAEREAWDSLDTDFLDCNPRATVSHRVYLDKTDAHEQLAGAFEDGSPDPDVFIGNADVVAREMICPDKKLVLEPLHTDDGSGLGERVFDRTVLQSVACDGSVYALPLAYHRLNTLYFNRDRLREVGVDPQQLTTWQSFLDALAKVSSGGRPALTVGSAAWYFSLLAFENVMIAAVEREGYERFWGGYDDENQELGSALAALEELRPYVEVADSAGARNAVTNGTAAFTVLGDWWVPASPSTTTELVDPNDPTVVEVTSFEGSNVGSIPFPGTAAWYVFSADVLAIPTHTDNLDGARAYLRAATSAGAMQRFAELKHARPAQPELSDFGGVTPVPGLPLLVPYLSFDELESEVAAWFKGSTSTEDLQAYVKKQYCHLSQTQTCPRTPDVVK